MLRASISREGSTRLGSLTTLSWLPYVALVEDGPELGEGGWIWERHELFQLCWLESGRPSSGSSMLIALL